MAGVKGRSGGARPGAGRPKGRKNPATLEREAVMTSIDSSLKALLARTEIVMTQRRNDHESVPAILKRLTEIERHLHMRETHRHQQTSRHAPLGREGAKPGGPPIPPPA